MRVLAIDPSLTSLGWASHKEDGKMDLGVVKQKAGQKGVHRLAYVQRRVASLIDDVGPQLVVYEGYAMGVAASKGQVFHLGELGGVLKLMIYQRSIGLLLVSPSSLKMYVTGKGNAKKDEVAAVLRKEAGNIFSSYDESDAWGLLMMGLAYLDARRLPRLRDSPKRRALQNCEYIPGKR